MLWHTTKINLLSEAEIFDLYARPEFNKNEREVYFSLTKQEQTTLNTYTDLNTRVFFILQLGYFKAKQQFFKFDLTEVKDDVKFIINTYFKEYKLTLSGYLSRDYIKKQKQNVLSLFNYDEWSSKYEAQTESHLRELLRYYPKIHNALRQLLNYFENQQIVIPTYRTLQDLFTTAFKLEEKRFDQIVSTIPEHYQKQLEALLENDNGLSQLNIVRADQKDFQLTAVKTEVEKSQSLADLYEFAKSFIPMLGLSKNAVRYYADLVEQYTLSRLRKLGKTQQLLYVICFVFHHYQQIMDNLITSFIYHTRAILDAGKTYASMAQMEHNSHMIVDFPKLAKFLEWIPNRSEQLSYSALNQEAYNILPKEQFPTLVKFLEGNKFDKEAAKWEFYLKSSRMFSLYLRPIFMAIPFGFYKENNTIMELIDLLKTHYTSGKNPAMFKLTDDLGLTIPKHMTQYLERKASNDGSIDPYLFEFYVYKKVYHQLDRGKLYCNDSLSYCDIDCDLIDDNAVDKVEEIAAKFGYPKLPIYCDKRLDDALAALDNAWNATTENINFGHNLGFNIKETKTGQQDWNLLYDSSEKLDDAFFRKLPKVEIAEVLMFIGDFLGLWNGFEHMKDRYIKRKTPIPFAINACLLSEAFGFSTEKMAEMSDLNINLLQSTRDDFIRVDTLCKINDMVSNFIKTLPIFNRWNLLENKILADADGQKFATSDSTIQSRYSKKYIGKGKGISLYTLIANFVAVNAKNIGLNEYEGHYLYDMIYNNKTDIEINMVTGDNHSLNKLNFVALDSIDVDYVPSIKNIRTAADDLYSVKTTDNYTGYIIPNGQINVNRIKSQKRGILRILLSLITQENTQSNIIRKLNSHARYARLKAALFEYNKIFKSIHVLNLIDSMQLRKVIRTARNRTEAYHQLQGMIRKIYNGIFKGQKVVDNRVSAHAARLISNCIIAYNSIILNTVYEKMVKDGAAQNTIDEFARISPIAWIHILFTGRYIFEKINGKIDIKAMAQALEQHFKTTSR